MIPTARGIRKQSNPIKFGYGSGILWCKLVTETHSLAYLREWVPIPAELKISNPAVIPIKCSCVISPVKMQILLAVSSTNTPTGVNIFIYVQ